MKNWIRTKVSKKKKRYQEDGYDLDLAYIRDDDGPLIIAMGFPSAGFESVYRNDCDEVKDFLDKKHGDKYWVFNLCSERCYDPEVFYGRVSRYPFDDHNPPKFDLIRQFCIEAAQYLSKDRGNCAVVHCKAGKGRTGLMICALLLHLRIRPTADEVLKYYGEKRTYDGKGVTIPSQRRYLFYYERFLNSGIPIDQPTPIYTCRIKKIVVKNVPEDYLDDEYELRINTMVDAFNPDDKPEFDQIVCTQNKKYRKKKALKFDLDEDLPEFSGDFCVTAMLKKKVKWFIWFNSSFVVRLESFKRIDIDKVAKKKDVNDDFTLYVKFELDPKNIFSKEEEESNEISPDLCARGRMKGENNSTENDFLLSAESSIKSPFKRMSSHFDCNETFQSPLTPKPQDAIEEIPEETIKESKEENKEERNDQASVTSTPTRKSHRHSSKKHKSKSKKNHIDSEENKNETKQNGKITTKDEHDLEENAPPNSDCS